MRCDRGDLGDVQGDLDGPGDVPTDHDDLDDDHGVCLYPCRSSRVLPIL